MSAKEKLVLYHQDSLHDFTDYGIEIPLLNQRTLQTIEQLQELGDFYDTFETFLTLKDLDEVHNKSMLDLAQNDPDKLVQQAYELIDDEGNYCRYNPANAKKPLADYINKAMIHLNGTYHGVKRSLHTGVCYHLGGGMHHAMSFRPGGFCIFNDIVAAIRLVQKESLVKKAIVIDLDAHKGDGTAELTLGDPSIFSFSIHMAQGWPLDKEDPQDKSFTPSSLDVPVLPTDDYQQKLERALNSIDYDFDMAIVVHGADVFEEDELESANLIQLTEEQVLDRDKFVYHLLKDKGIAQTWVMAGGYGKNVYKVFANFIRYLHSSL